MPFATVLSHPKALVQLKGVVLFIVIVDAYCKDRTDKNCVHINLFFNCIHVDDNPPVFISVDPA